MASHERFHYRNVSELSADIARLGLDLPLGQDLSVFSRPLSLGGKTVPNRLAIHPMEGCDGRADGAPGELTLRRYDRFAAGGAGLLWFEATAVVPEGRANPRQLMLNDQTAGAFEAMLRRSLAAAAGVGVRPVCLLQLTHSGRYSRPVDKRQPIIAHHSAVLDPLHNLPADYPLVSDVELDDLQGAYVRAAMLARQIGFDGVDIKACHRYLINELLASHERPGRYGGSYENRTRFLRETVRAVRQAAGDDFVLAVRMNVYDGIPHPYGWGVPAGDQNQMPPPDLSEPLRLAAELAQAGVTCISVTAGNPYYKPFINRPADKYGNDLAPPEHPLEGVARMVHLARQIQQAHAGLCVLGAGLSWLREFLPASGAAVLANGWASLVGLGREAFAYPDFPRDLLTAGAVDPKKVCIACGGCSQIMRNGGTSGCPVRDSAIYKPIYDAGR